MKALEDGEIKKIRGQNNEVLYAAASAKVGRTRGTEHSETIHRGQALTDEQYAKAKKYLSTLKWDFPEPSRQQLQAEEKKGELNEETLKRISDAASAMNGTARAAEKMLPLANKLKSTAGAKSASELKDALKALYKHITIINEIQQGINDPWKNSSGLREDLVAAAEATVTCQDAVKMAKALVEAK